MSRWQQELAEAVFSGLAIATVINWLGGALAIAAARYDLAGYLVATGLACVLTCAALWRAPAP